eukprot:scaffold91161_cov18-Cyclotella_meneghiniana.AAC.1
MQYAKAKGNGLRHSKFSSLCLQYVWVQMYRAFVKMLSVVKVTLAVDCCDETSPIHLLGFALKLDIDEVIAERSYSGETILLA